MSERAAKILVVDDDPIIYTICERVLGGAGYRVVGVTSGSACLQALEKEVYDLVLLDYKMPAMDGLEVLGHIRRGATADLGIILITGFGTLESAVQAFRLGVQDYITKPLVPEQLLPAVQRGLEATQIQRSLRRAREERGSGRRFDYLVGESPALQEVLDLVARMVPLPQTPVLILGETGTGKSLVARALHESSPRAAQPFVSVNCAALPANLVEVELFGAEAGAFTDAKEARAGLIEQAQGGTLFLDEIGALPLSLQPKLLYFLEERSYRRVGGTEERRVDVRVIAATNRDLERAMQEGEFRADLYFRLHVLPLRLPPLRDRGDDVILLAHHFLHQFNRELGKKVQGLDPEAETLLRRYPWPGNVRELRNVIERAILLSSVPLLTARDLVGLQPETSILQEEDPVTLEEAERRHILRVLEQAEGNQRQAARLLNISRETLRSKLKKWGLL